MGPPCQRNLANLTPLEALSYLQLPLELLHSLLHKHLPRRYRTPNMEDIDKVGIQPDTACTLGEPGRHAAAGVPVDRKTASSVLSQLQEDSCVLTAEQLLEGQIIHS